MDIADINKVANCKRLKVDAEKLREKVSRETAKIIKLKVAQDTAYWELKEKLQQAEGNHERLKQNMVELQMQHEAVSGKYQEELRVRPEILNKLNSTRSIGNVLVEHYERLKETLAQCISDHAAQSAALKHSGEIVQGLVQQQRQTEAEDRAKIAQLEQANQLITENRDQLVQAFSSSQQQHEQTILDLRNRLREAEEKRDKLMNVSYELTREVDKQKHEQEVRDETITRLQGERKRMIQEFNHKCAEMKSIIQKQENDLKESSSANEDLKRAVANQEEVTRSVCRQSDEQQEKMAALEEEAAGLHQELTALQEKLQDYTSTCDILRQDVASLVGTKKGLEKQIQDMQQDYTSTYDSLNQDVASLLETKEGLEKQMQDMQQEFEVTRDGLNAELAALQDNKQKLEKDIDDKNQQIVTSDSKIEILSIQLQTLELNNAAANAILDTTTTESAAKSTAIEALNSSVQEMEASLNEARAKINDLTATSEQMRADNTSQWVNITKLTDDVKKYMSINSELENCVERLKNELEMERESSKQFKSELQNCIERLNKELETERESSKQKERRWLSQAEGFHGAIKEKDQELSKQMTLILETRAEKEKLQEKISGMQSIIDNVQKELNDYGRAAPRPLLPADQDDNAVSFTPLKPVVSSQPAQEADGFAVPMGGERRRRKEITMFNMFSDSSKDSETKPVVSSQPAQEADGFAVPMGGERRRRKEITMFNMFSDSSNDSETKPVVSSQPAQEADGFAVPMGGERRRRKEITMFNMFSDSSNDSETPAERERHFESLRRRPAAPPAGPASAPAPRPAPPARKRRHAGTQQERAAPRPQSPILGSQKQEPKEKRFFKSKRPENIFKKALLYDNLDL